MVDNCVFLSRLKMAVEKAEFVLSICTGAALLARCGLLDGKKATSNKMALDWVKSTGAAVYWQERARWVTDGKFYTSSGVSAGIDMALGFVEDQWGRAQAEWIARRIEYLWNDKKENDPFA